MLESLNALLLPVESLIRTAQGWRAWVLADDQAQHRMVTAGRTENDVAVPVGDGQHEGPGRCVNLSGMVNGWIQYRQVI